MYIKRKELWKANLHFYTFIRWVSGIITYENKIQLANTLVSSHLKTTQTQSSVPTSMTCISYMYLFCNCCKINSLKFWRKKEDQFYSLNSSYTRYTLHTGYFETSVNNAILRYFYQLVLTELKLDLDIAIDIFVF